MKKKSIEISYKDLSSKQLENLKDIYIESRVLSMSENDLKEFVRMIISDQIKGTIGNEEEKEAWKEMKDFFLDDFEQRIKDIIKTNKKEDEVPPEQLELQKRIEILEQRKKEKGEQNEDMW